MGAISPVKGCKLQREKEEISRVQIKRHLCSHACNPDVGDEMPQRTREGGDHHKRSTWWWNKPNFRGECIHWGQLEVRQVKEAYFSDLYKEETRPQIMAGAS